MSEIYGLRYGNEIRYVGKTSATGQRRLCGHIANARRGVGRQRRLSSWLRSLPGPPEIVVLEKNPPGSLDAAEKSWIATLIAYGCRLTNMTPGGEGQPRGYVPSPESRLKNAASHRGRVKSLRERASISAALLGHPVSVETRAKISAARRKHRGSVYARDVSARQRDASGRFVPDNTSQLAGSTT